ncbi:MAG: GTP 3',8-cyclase MoaA [Planctomycetota bacterium]
MDAHVRFSRKKDRREVERPPTPGVSPSFLLAKGIDKLRVSVTDRCNLRCTYCLPEEGVTLVPHREVLRYEEITEIVRALIQYGGLRRVRITGGEPLLRPQLAELVRMLASEGLEEVTLTTNGHLLPKRAPALKSAGLGRVNISLDSVRPQTYGDLTGGGSLEKVFAGIQAAVKADLTPVKLNAVVLRGINDDELPDLVRFAAVIGAQVRFLEAMCIGELSRGHKERFVPLREMIERLASEFKVELRGHPEGETARPALLRDRRTGRRVEVGFIPSESAPFCRSCRRLRLTATGRLLGCLLSDEGEDLRAWVRASSPGRIERFCAMVKRTFEKKPLQRGEANPEFMSRIGG